MTGAVVSTTTTFVGPGTLLPPVNPQLVNRLVGYLEYGKALVMLGRLLEVSTHSELNVIDEIVSDRDEFTIYTNLSRRLEHRTSSLRELPRKKDDDFSRRGLAWIMALARVEIGAMAAGFTERPEPFQVSLPSSVEAAAYKEIMEDSMRMHYWALQNDPVIRTLRAGATPEQQAIAYARRVAVSIEFLQAVRQVNRQDYDPVQHRELDLWESQLDQLKSYLLFKVLKLQDPAILRSQSSNVRLNACPRLQEMAKAEIRAGTAKLSADSPSVVDDVKARVAPGHSNGSAASGSGRAASNPGGRSPTRAGRTTPPPPSLKP